MATITNLEKFLSCNSSYAHDLRQQSCSDRGVCGRGCAPCCPHARACGRAACVCPGPDPDRGHGPGRGRGPVRGPCRGRGLVRGGGSAPHPHGRGCGSGRDAHVLARSLGPTSWPASSSSGLRAPKAATQPSTRARNPARCLSGPRKAARKQPDRHLPLWPTSTAAAVWQRRGVLGSDPASSLFLDVGSSELAFLDFAGYS